MSRSPVLPALLTLALFGCSAPQVLGADAAPGAAQDPEAPFLASSDSEVRVREDGLTLWVDTPARPVYRGATLQVILSGRTSSNLKEVFSSVPDDAFGSAAIVGPRSFTVTLRDGHEINTLLSGLPILIRLGLSNGRTYHARVELAPRFASSTGSAAISLDAPILPIYYNEGPTALRYRGTAGVTAPMLTVMTSGGAAPATAPLGAGLFRFDWEYSSLAQVFDQTTDRITLSAATGGMTVTKTAAIELGIKNVELTGGDPSTRWPDPRCAKTVYDCIQMQPAGTKDLASCGSYRDVTRCLYADVCDVEPTPMLPFELKSTDASALAPAVKNAHDKCPRNSGSWCTVGPAQAFTYAPCTAMSPTPDQVHTAALMATDRSGAFDPRYGSSLTRAELSMAQAFKTGLLTAIDAFAGDTDVRAVLFEAEEPCHNCHQFAQKYVLFYPKTRVVVVVDGSHGYDS